MKEKRKAAIERDKTLIEALRKQNDDLLRRMEAIEGRSTKQDSDLIDLPWVNHRSRKWEPEPFRWLGANAGLRVMTSADAAEARTGRPTRRAALFARKIGH